MDNINDNPEIYTSLSDPMPVEEESKIEPIIPEPTELNFINETADSGTTELDINNGKIVIGQPNETEINKKMETGFRVIKPGKNLSRNITEFTKNDKLALPLKRYLKEIYERYKPVLGPDKAENISRIIDELMAISIEKLELVLPKKDQMVYRENRKLLHCEIQTKFKEIFLTRTKDVILDRFFEIFIENIKLYILKRKNHNMGINNKKLFQSIFLNICLVDEKSHCTSQQMQIYKNLAFEIMKFIETIMLKINTEIE